MKNLEYSVASYRYDIEFWALQPNYSIAPECPPAVQSNEKLVLQGYNEIYLYQKYPIFSNSLYPLPKDPEMTITGILYFFALKDTATGDFYARNHENFNEGEWRVYSKMTD